MTGVGDDSRGRLMGRPWLVVGFILAIGATLALVLSDDLRYLRLAIVAALWAALIGAFLAVKYRKHAAHSEDAVAEAQAVYELELEREIAARREYELEIEAENREAAESRSRDELDALRAEVTALRESLQSLFGGEVLLERVALTAQATRMRSLKDDQRLVSAAPESNGKPAQLTAAKKTFDVAEQRTELIDRVLEQASVSSVSSVSERRRKAPVVGSSTGSSNGSATGGRSNGRGLTRPQNLQNAQSTQQISRPKPPASRPSPAEEPPRPAPKPESNGSEATRVSKPTAASDGLRREPLRQSESRPEPQRTEARRPEPQRSETLRTEPPRPEPKRAEPPRSQPPRAESARGQAEPASRPQQSASLPKPKPAPVPEPQSPRSRVEPELTRPAMDRIERGRPAASVTPPARAQKPAEPAPTPKETTADWKPSWEERPVSDLSAAFPSRDDFADRLRPNRPLPPERKPEPAAETPSRHGAHRSPADEPVVEVNPTLPEEARELQSRPGGRRRRAEDDDAVAIPSTPSTPAPAAEAAGGGRRRRPEGEPPAWQGGSSSGGSHSANGTGSYSVNGSNGSSGSNGSATNGSGGHSRPDTGTNGSARGRRSEDREEAAAGSHAAGRSVNELLAAHGANESAPRRRRRAED